MATNSTYSQYAADEEGLDEIADPEMKELGEEETIGISKPKKAEEAGYFEDVEFEEESEEDPEELEGEEI